MFAHAGAQALQSGAYEDLLGAYDPATQRVTGYFSQQTGAGQFSCIFFLTGLLHGAEAAITTYFPKTPKDDVIAGHFDVQESNSVKVELATEHGGCWNVEHFADKDQPAHFNLMRAYPWTSIAVVRAAKSYFYDAPGAAKPRQAYVVEGDGLGVRASRSGWLQVDYVNDTKHVSGWIRQADVFPTR